MVSSYFGGHTPKDLLELHNKYGPVVRTSPDELSYINAPQWKEIYGFKTGKLEFSKDEKYHSGLTREPLILNADQHYHGYIRKLFAFGFSEKAMREQEPILKEYINLMFRRVVEESKEGAQPVDILQWYNVSVCYKVIA
jgi:cytochrome P450